MKENKNIKLKMEAKNQFSNSNPAMKILTGENERDKKITKKAIQYRKDLKSNVLMSRRFNIDTFEKEFQEDGRKIQLEDAKFMYDWSINKYKGIIDEMITNFKESIYRFNKTHNCNLSIDEIENSPLDGLEKFNHQELRDGVFEIVDEMKEEIFLDDTMYINEVAWIDVILCRKLCDYIIIYTSCIKEKWGKKYIKLNKEFESELLEIIENAMINIQALNIVSYERNVALYSEDIALTLVEVTTELAINNLYWN